jgi:hypothetical protein
MNRHRTPILTAIAAIAAVGVLVATALIVVPARATEPSGVTTTMIGVGRSGRSTPRPRRTSIPAPVPIPGRPGSRPREARISMSWRTRSHRAGPSVGTAIPAPAW